MRLRRLASALLIPVVMGAQSPSATATSIEFLRFESLFSGRLVAAFKDIPAAQYGYRPTPTQQTIGYIAQHLEEANYSLCELIGGPEYPRPTKSSLADTIKAVWPKDTLVARLDASFSYCEVILKRLGPVESPATMNTLLAFETDLAEHYSQLSVYMRLIGLVPPSAMPPKARTAIDIPAAELSKYVGRYQVAAGLDLVVTMKDAALSIQSVPGGRVVRLWPESATVFFVKDSDVQVTFTRDASSAVSALVFRQFDRDTQAKRIP